MFKVPSWLLIIIALNVAIFLIVLRPNPSKGIPTIENNVTNQPVINETPQTNQSLNQTLNQSINQTNQTINQTFNDSIYTSNCINSISNYVKGIENITNFTTIETRFFNQTEDAINYVRNWSSNSFELIGTGKDIYSLNKTNKTTISINDFKRDDGKSFVLPTVCDENGTIGSYSSCMLGNISNITSYCHSMTTSLSECDMEEMQYDFWQDISYWITPKPGPLNESQLFNFTIASSRNRLEYASIFVWYIRPPLIDQQLFNQSLSTAKGDRIEITTTLNLTGKIYGGLVLETYFKKKCYKYDILTQYLY